MQPYEEYEEYNRFLGLVTAVLGIAPVFILVYPVYFGRTTAQRTLLRSDHIWFISAWLYFAVAHGIIYLPFVTAWVLLSSGIDAL